MTEQTTYLQLFTIFSKVGLFTLGGGYAMVPLMEKEVVDDKQWLAREEFMDILAVAQATPGLFAMNMASHIGNKLRGVLLLVSRWQNRQESIATTSGFLFLLVCSLPLSAFLLSG